MSLLPGCIPSAVSELAGCLDPHKGRALMPKAVNDAARAGDLQVIGGDAESTCLSTAGYPPWAVRFCEIYALGAMRTVTAASIHAAFWTYSRTTQNFGV